MEKSSPKKSLPLKEVADNLNVHNAKAVRVMASKLASIRTKVQNLIDFLEKYNGPVVKRLFPRLSAAILILEEILTIISEKPSENVGVTV